MITQTLNYAALVERLPADATLVLRHVRWEEYQELLEAVGEAAGLRISYNEGIMRVMTLSAEHENYVEVIQDLVRLCTMRLGLRLRSFGSVTMKTERMAKGSEPDCCFYIQSADRIGTRKRIDFASDPPPDIVVEVDIHHESLSKLPIYAALGVPEIWRYDGQRLSIYHWQSDTYIPAAVSQALPLLTSELLTEFLARTRDEDENAVLLAFERWLQEPK